MGRGESSRFQPKSQSWKVTELGCVFGSDPELVSQHHAGWIKVLRGVCHPESPNWPSLPLEPTGVAPGGHQTFLEPTTDIHPKQPLSTLAHVSPS